MHPIRRILVAVKDPASKSLPAVTKAARLARAFDAELELFHGISGRLYVDAYSDSGALPEIERTTRVNCLKQLDTIANKLRRQGLTVATSAEWDYPVYEAVVRRATGIKADLIVAERPTSSCRRACGRRNRIYRTQDAQCHCRHGRDLAIGPQAFIHREYCRGIT